MGLLDTATEMLDAATGGQATSKADAKAEFLLKEILTAPDDADAGIVGTSYTGQGDNPNPLDGGITTEFIHFGQVHPDTGKKFPHNSFDPAKPKVPVPEGHGIMFRDAVEREAITLFAFVSSTKIAVKETTESRGALEAVGAMASNLLGGGSGQSKPDPTQLDTFLTDIESAIQTINKPAILYPEIHEAGKKLHETRAKYLKFCENLNAFYVKPPEGSPLDAAAGAIANIPGVGNIMATVQRFAFKFLDLYLAGYLKLRENHEKSIESAAHDLTLEAIKANFEDFNATYPIWFKKAPPPEEETGDSKDKKDDDNLLADVNKKIDEAKKKVDETKKKVEDTVNDAYDFLGMNNSPEATPGTGRLGEIFGNLKGPAETTPGAPPSGSACLIEGIDAAMKDIHGIPEFVKKVMTKINDANVGLLEDVFGRMMAMGCEKPIDSQMLLQAGRHHLSQKIVTIMGDLAGGVLPGGGNFSMAMPGGKTLDAQQFIAKLIEDKLIHYVDPIIKYAIGDLAGQMEASRSKAQDNKAQTMEVLLGRLPWLTAVMFRNTFFPMWNLVIEKVFETVSPQIAKVVKAVNSVFEKAKDTVDKVSDYQHRAENVQKAASGEHDLLHDDVIGNVKDAAKTESEESKARKAEREKANQEKQELEDFYKPNDKDEKFPVKSRVLDGEGQKVTDDVESVVPTTPPQQETAPQETPAPQEAVPTP